jgi:glycosyltransferase involved in cell wall biosynthesis
VICNGLRKPFSGRAKVLRNFARGLDADLLLTGPEDVVRTAAGLYARTKVFDSDEQLRAHVRSNDFTYLFVDDIGPPWAGENRERVVRYVYPMKGLRGIGGLPVNRGGSSVERWKQRLAFLGGRTRMFRYLNRIRRSHVVIAQSHSVDGLLRYYYGIQVDLVLLSPLDIEQFRPRLQASDKFASNRVLLFLGTGPSDTDTRLLRALSPVFSKHSIEVHAFGDAPHAESLSGCNFIFHPNLTDDALAEQYQRAKYCITPQYDELFGLVPCESMAAGTPVLSTYSQETVDEGLTGYASSQSNFPNLLDHVLSGGPTKDEYGRMTEACRLLSKEYDLNTVSNRLQRYLRLLDGN